MIKDENVIRSTLNFGIGYNPVERYHSIHASNYRMSDISASYILSYLENNFDDIVDKHKKIYEYYKSNLPSNCKLFPNFSEDVPVCSSICILFKDKINLNDFPFIARKYYYPLDKKCLISNDFYEKIICLPCNKDLTENQLDYIINYLASL